MSTAINKTTAIVGITDFDEETWLVEPPNLRTQSNSGQQSGRIDEWLQGAAKNVDFQTRSALSRKLANQAARKKKRAEKLREKVRSVSENSGGYLSQVQEEPTGMNKFYDYNDDREDLNEDEAVISKWNDSSVPVLNEKLNKHHWEISNEQQQYQQETTTVSSVLSVRQIENIMMSDDNDDNDDDENDEFYDASSDFNDIPLSSTAITTAIDATNVMSSTVESQYDSSEISDSRDKVISNGTSLAAVRECIELSADSSANNISLLSSNGSGYEERQIRQINTARVPPMIAQHVTSQRSSSLDKSKSPCRSAKSHSPSMQLDLKDIKSIVERQEAELRKELSRRKSSVMSENANKTFSSNARESQVQSTRRGTIPLASSKSIEFNANIAKLSGVGTPSPVFHPSRLPTPVRKSVGRSLIPTPRASALTKSAIRGLAGGSTPSLVSSSQHIYDETRSECGGMSRNEQQWTDECF